MSAYSSMYLVSKSLYQSLLNDKNKSIDLPTSINIRQLNSLHEPAKVTIRNDNNYALQKVKKTNMQTSQNNVESINSVSTITFNSSR